MKVRETLEILTGRGTVEVNGHFICEADYEIRVDQEMVGDRGSIPGLLRLSGVVNPRTDGEIPELFLREGLSLTMTDGRWVKFSFTDMDSKTVVVQSPINRPARSA